MTNTTATTNTTTTTTNLDIVNNILAGISSLANIVTGGFTLPSLREKFVAELENSGLDAGEQYKLLTEFDEELDKCTPTAQPSEVDLIINEAEDFSRQLAVEMAIEQHSNCRRTQPVVDEVDTNDWGSHAKNPVDGKMFVPGTGIVLSRREALEVLTQARNTPCPDGSTQPPAAITVGIKAMRGLSSFGM